MFHIQDKIISAQKPHAHILRRNNLNVKPNDPQKKYAKYNFIGVDYIYGRSMGVYR